jgi:hypothetical protein
MPNPCPIEEIFNANQVDWLPHDKNLELFVLNETKRYIKNSWQEFNALATENIPQFLANSSDVLNIKSGIMYMNAFAVNPFLKDRLRELGFKDPAQFKLQFVFHDWFNKLFKLSDKSAAEYALRLNKAKKNKPGYKLICAQVRMGGQTAGKSSDHVFSNQGTSKLFWKFIKQNFLTKSKLNGSNYMIYVTSDNNKVKQEARNYFGAKKVVTFEKSNFHIDFDLNDSQNSRVTKADKCKLVSNILLDFHMLSECDMAVASHSGFGMLGLWNRPDPGKDLYVYSNKQFIDGHFARDNLTFIKLDDLGGFNFYLRR